MKKRIKNAVHLLPLVIALGMITINAKAQFNKATIVETATGVGPVVVENTGNDIYKVSSNVFLKVSVWEDGGGNPGIIGDDGNTTATSGFTYTDATDPDVCIVKQGGGSNIYAIAVYWSGAQSNYYMEWFRWNAGWAASGLATVGTTAGAVTINIDGNPYGEFVIVWDDGQGNVMTYGGRTTGNPALSASGSVAVANNGNTGGSMPDVCLYDTLGVAELATYAFINTNNEIEIYGERFPSPGIFSGVTGNNLVHTVSLVNFNHIMSWPRIACVDGTIGGAYDVTVVYEDYDGLNNEYDIKAVNSRAGSYTFTGPRIYTNNSITGLTASPALNTVLNLRPVVTYGVNGGTYIGWILDNSGNNWTGTNPATQGVFPIMIICDNQAQPTYNRFLEVPDKPANSQQPFSLAGKFCNRNIYTFWDNTVPDVYYKDAPQSNNALRLGNKENVEVGITPNPFKDYAQVNLTDIDADYQFELCDVAGKAIYKSTLPANEVNGALLQATATLPKGVYIISIVSNNKQYNLVDKIIKM